MSLGASRTTNTHEPPGRMRRRGAEILDLVCVALVLLANVVAANGGFRWEFGSLRLSMASSSRALVLALILLLLRRWRFPGAPAHPWIARSWAAARARIDAARHALPLVPRAAAWAAGPGEWVAVAALFLALTAVMTVQQWMAFHSVSDLGDPLFSIWRLSWVAHQLPRDVLHLFDGNMFYPEPRTLAYSDAMLATAFIAAPFLWLGVPQVVVYNAIFLLSFAASGVAMYALVRGLTADRWAAVVAGVAFAFYPFRFEHFSHLELQITFWMPLALLMLHRTLDSGRVRDGAITGLLTALQALSSLYLGLFLLVVMAVVWVVVKWVPQAGEAGGAAPHPTTSVARSIAPWMAAAAVLVVLLLPVVYPYLQNRAQLGERPEWETRIYSATAGSYLTAHYRNVLYGGWLDWWRRPEQALFPGLSIVVLAVVGAWPKINSHRAAYLAAAVVAFEGSLGANGIVFPPLRDFVLPFRGLRVPARFSVLVGLCLAVLAGYGIQRLRQSGRLRGRMAALVPAALAALLMLENASNLDVVAVPPLPRVYEYFKGATPSVIAELPFPKDLVEATVDARSLYYSTFHWQRILTGSSGYFPESFRQAVKVLATFPDERGIEYLRRRGVDFIVIDRSACEEEYEKITGFLDAHPGVTVLRRSRLHGREDGVIYKMSRQ